MLGDAEEKQWLNSVKLQLKLDAQGPVIARLEVDIQFNISALQFFYNHFRDDTLQGKNHFVEFVSPTRISSPLQAQFSMKDSSCTEPLTSLSTSAEIMTSQFVMSESFIAQVRDDDVAMTSFLPALESHIEQIDEQSGLTSLLMAVNNKDNEWCVKLLMHKANVHAKDQKERTVLHIALRNSGGEDLLPLLLKHHADPNVADKNGRTPLHYCVEYNKPNAAKILLGTLASKEATDMAGETALQLAIRRRRTSLTEILLDDGATVDRTGMSRSSDDIEYLLDQQRKRRTANGVESVIIRQHSNLTTRSGLSIQTASSKSFLRQRLNMKRFMCHGVTGHLDLPVTRRTI